MNAIDKSVKYDRQLRLWAANGQAALENSRIALINGNATGSETLKNLVLPGIGSYTIIDNHTIQAADTGSNFFLDVDCIGQSRAKTVCEYLQELNSDVTGRYLDQDPADLILSDPKYFQNNFDLVVVADLASDPLLQLSKILWDANIPLLVVQSSGFMGYLRISLPEHTIIESHPDSITDLRLDVPWPELSALATTMDLTRMNDNEHTHVPYILLLLYYLEQWKTQHNGSPPATFEDKTQFKSCIRSGMRNADEDNFDEAIANVWRACGKTSIPSDVKQVLDDPAAHSSLTHESADFWFLTRAVCEFVKERGLLPVSGSLPDMKSDTSRYIALQRAYREKALSDISEVKNHFVTLLSEHGKSKTAISDTEIETFCKHAGFLKVIRYRSLQVEQATPNLEVLKSAMADPNSTIFWYLAKRAAESFAVFPGQDSTRPLEEAQLELERAVLESPTIQPFLTDEAKSSIGQVCSELTRCGNAELHNIASFMGGMAAQEIIKIITKQYVPVNNTVIFDGIRSVTTVFEL